MLVVVALIGIVAALALPRYRHATVRAKESVLKHDLWVMRDVIDQFFTDLGRYPNDLEEVVSMGYMRKVPVDPMTDDAISGPITAPVPFTRSNELLAPIALPGADQSSVYVNRSE